MLRHEDTKTDVRIHKILIPLKFQIAPRRLGMNQVFWKIKNKTAGENSIYDVFML